MVTSELLQTLDQISSAQTEVKPLQLLERKSCSHKFALKDPGYIPFFQVASIHLPSLIPLEEKPHAGGVSSACTSQVLTTSQMPQGKNIRHLGEREGQQKKVLVLYMVMDAGTALCPCFW